jgi:hypothetical protein
MDIQPFTVHIPETELVDLQTRLGRTRWPDEIAGADWAYGANLAYLHDLVRAATRFDSRAQERASTPRALPRHPRGVGILYPPARQRAGPTPLIITHGWPGSFIELLRSYRCFAIRLATVGMRGMHSTW